MAIQSPGPVLDFPIVERRPALAFDAVENPKRSLVPRAGPVGQDQPLGAQPLPQIAAKLDHAHAVQVPTLKDAVVDLSIPVAIGAQLSASAQLVVQHVEFQSVEGLQFTPGMELPGQHGRMDLGAGPPLAVFRADGRVVVVPEQIRFLAPGALGHMGGRVAPGRRKGHGPAAVAPPADANRPLLSIEGNELDLLAPMPIGPPLLVEHAQSDVVVRPAVPSRPGAEQIGIGDLDLRFPFFSRNVGENLAAIVIQKMPGKEIVELIPRITGVAVVVEEHQLLGVVPLHPGEGLDVAKGSPRDLFIQNPPLVTHPRIRRRPFGTAKEEHPRIAARDGRQHRRVAGRQLGGQGQKEQRHRDREATKHVRSLQTERSPGSISGNPGAPCFRSQVVGNRPRRNFWFCT